MGRKHPLQGSRGHVCLYHVPLVPFISECHVTDDGDILHLLPLKAPSGNPELPCPLPRLPTPSVHVLLFIPLSNKGLGFIVNANVLFLPQPAEEAAEL